MLRSFFYFKITGDEISLAALGLFSSCHKIHPT